MSETKLLICRDCKHLGRHQLTDWKYQWLVVHCLAPQHKEVNLVTGDVQLVPAEARYARASVDTSKCGPSGQWFEQAVTVEVAAAPGSQGKGNDKSWLAGVRTLTPAEILAKASGGKKLSLGDI
jgi:hypothetical protein